MTGARGNLLRSHVIRHISSVQPSRLQFSANLKKAREKGARKAAAAARKREKDASHTLRLCLDQFAGSAITDLSVAGDSFSSLPALRIHVLQRRFPSPAKLLKKILEKEKKKRKKKKKKRDKKTVLLQLTKRLPAYLAHTIIHN
ncbi:hypothetical protein PUN28_019905 [Cardiocondyla obscurior]|uniref:Uncharacterized protein n=1 Tax=Cardiocondyla obscurior TaxID=286306 RepID=A0AAW2E8T7_9HYME